MLLRNKEYISEHEEPHQKIFYSGQIYDAFSLLSGLISKAMSNIVLIDGYVDTGTLDVMSKKKQGVDVTVYTTQRGCKLTASEIASFNLQYNGLEIKYTNVFHDRFLILDNKICYHIGASVKDAGKKCFAISLMEDVQMVQDLMART